jgi:glycerol-3-phosphate dehydrogenase (NAD(P)+)
MAIERIAIVGAGAWGTALANAIARAGRQVTLLNRNRESADAMARTRVSPRLPGTRIADGVTIAAVGPDALAGQEAVLLVVPAQALRTVARNLAPMLVGNVTVIACAKGIERGTHKFMTQVIAECLPDAQPAILSGPSFAEEVARGLPAAVTLATNEEALGAALSHAFGSATFRPYHSTDVRGAEIGGAAKNVLAIGAGIVSGRGLGASAAAALTTRGFAELFRFGRALGARPETLTGLSGLGDLILTCSSTQSRNFSLGIALGRGQTLHEASTAAGLAEGAFTAAALVELATQLGMEMPVATAVAAILDGTLAIDQAIEALMTRPFRAEG